MNLQITARHYKKGEVGVDEKLKSYIEKKASKLEVLLPAHAKKSVIAEAVIDEINKKVGAQKFKFELKFKLPEKTLVASAKDKNEGAAVDSVEKKMISQIAKYKTQHANKKVDRKGISKIRKFFRKKDQKSK
jgi:ribosomal subunit interface protein